MKSISVEHSLHPSSKQLVQWLYAACHKKEETESMQGDTLNMFMLIVRSG